MLSIISVTKGYKNNKWLTFKQAKELGGFVKKGQKASTVFYCSSAIVKDEEKEEKEIFFKKSYYVFNVEQIDNLPEEFYQQPSTGINKDIKNHDQIDQLIKKHNVKLISADQNSAYTALVRDYINMPDISKFKNSDSYYATLLHELSHWTGHEKRLNREYLEDYIHNKKNRAKEELTAEIASMFLSSHFNIKAGKENHISYLKSWAKILKEDKKAIFTASTQAQKIFNYLINQ